MPFISNNINASVIAYASLAMPKYNTVKILNPSERLVIMLCPLSVLSCVKAIFVIPITIRAR